MLACGSPASHRAPLIEPPRFAVSTGYENAPFSWIHKIIRCRIANFELFLPPFFYASAPASWSNSLILDIWNTISSILKPKSSTLKNLCIWYPLWNIVLCSSLTFIRHFAVNACLAPLCSVDGMAVTTVEGLGSSTTRLHPVQVAATLNLLSKLFSPLLWLHIVLEVAVLYHVIHCCKRPIRGLYGPDPGTLFFVFTDTALVMLACDLYHLKRNQ